MHIFYQVSTGKIISLSNTIDTDSAPDDYAYLPCSYEVSELYKYEVVNGVIQEKQASEIAQIEQTEAWFKLRIKRDELLKQSDWVLFEDSPISDAKKAEWRTYRQALRDITNTSDPANVTWPSQPT
jgi:ribulose 1,5-bisphosphate carboxylase large subunit-like protein